MTAATALLGLGAASCGGEEGPETASMAPQSRGGEGAPQQGGDRDGGDSAQQGGGSDRQAGGGSKERKNSSSARFTPRPHEDSGGGSEQFRIPGGDNSVQEFGEEGEGDEFEAAATALHGFFDARAERAWAAACNYLAAALVASLEGRSSPTDKDDVSCATGLERFTNPNAGRALRKEAQEVDIGSLRAEGDTGFILYRDGKGTVYAIAMANEDGSWKVANLAGLPLS